MHANEWKHFEIKMGSRLFYKANLDFDDKTFDRKLVTFSEFKNILRNVVEPFAKNYNPVL